MTDKEFRITDENLSGVTELKMIFGDVAVESSNEATTESIRRSAIQLALSTSTEAEGVMRFQVRHVVVDGDKPDRKEYSGMAFKHN